MIEDAFLLLPTEVNAFGHCLVKKKIVYLFEHENFFGTLVFLKHFKN